MLYKFLIIVQFFCYINIANSQSDTSVYQKKLAFKEKELSYQDGKTIFLMDAIYKEWDKNRFMWGFYNVETKKKTTEAIYDTLGYRYMASNKKGYYVVKKQQKMGLMHQDQSVFVPIVYDKINYNVGVKGNFISVQSNQKYGVLDTAGNVLLEVKYDDIHFDGFRFLVALNGQNGLFSSTGKALIPLCFDEILHHNFVDRINLKKGDKWSVYNWIKSQPCNFEKSYDHIDGLMDYYVVRDGAKFGLLDIDAQTILPFEYDFMAPFFVKFLRSILVGKDKKVGVLRIDSLGNTITAVPIEFSDVWVDKTTLKIKVRKDDRIDYYFEDRTLFDLAYNDVQYYHHLDAIMVKKGSKWGMLSPEGESILPIEFAAIHVMANNQFMVKKGAKWGLLDAKGNELIPIQYDEFDYRPKKDFFFVKKGKYWGIVSTSRGVLLPPKYEDMVTLSNRTYLVQQKGKWGIVAAGGRSIVPAEFDSYKYKYKAREILMIRKDGSFRKVPLR